MKVSGETKYGFKLDECESKILEDAHDILEEIIRQMWIIEKLRRSKDGKNKKGEHKWEIIDALNVEIILETGCTTNLEENIREKDIALS